MVDNIPQVQDNINKYTSNINELLVAHESMVKLDANQNLLSRAVLSEYFYCDLLNKLMGWELKNANLEEKNTPGIDLIDVKRHIVVQVSLTCNHEKIQSSINKFQKPESASNWEFYFVPLKDEDIPHFKKDFVIPDGVRFDKEKNIFTKKRIVQLAQTPSSGEHYVDKLKRVSDILDKLMREQKNHNEICEYLSEVLKNKRENHPSFKLMAKDVIDEKLFTYPENEQFIPSLGIVGKKVAPIWELIKAEHKEEFRHIIIEGDGGIGKSVSLMSVTDDSELLSFIPAIYIHMYELCKDSKSISLAEYFKDKYSGFDEKISHLAAQPDQAGKPTLMLLLDGLNEVDFRLQYKLLDNILDWTECHCGTQLIVASRPIPGQQLESIIDNAVLIKLKPLDKECVKERLETFGITPPDDSSPIWETLKFPLFLTLYTKTAKLPDNTSRGYPIVKHEPVGQATIIWNYLQRELFRKKEDSWVLNCAFACEYISPEIAYRMALLNRFELSFEEANRFVDEAVSKVDTNNMPEHLSNIAKKYIRYHREFPTNNDFNWQTFVLDETGVFVEPKYKTDEKENCNYSFMHQSFRDCLAGLHLANVAQMALPEEEGGKLPSEWKSSIPPLILDYAAELMDADSAQKLWELNRTRCPEGAKIDTHSTYMQLELHRRLKTESDKLNFSGMDLRGMSFTNYMGGEYDLGLFASPKLASGTYLDRKVFESDGHRAPIRCILSLNTELIASGSYDATIRIWNINTGECIKTLKEHSGPVRCLTLLPDGRLASGSGDHTICIWNIKTGECIKKTIIEPAATCLAVLHDGRIVIASNDNIIRIWNIEKNEYIKTNINDKLSFVTSLAVLHDDRIVTASNDNTICTWDIIKKDEPKTIYSHSKSITCLATLPNDNIVIGSNDNTIKILDPNTSKCIKTLNGHSKAVACISVLPNGRIISSSDDRTIRIWDEETLKCIKTLDTLSLIAAITDNYIACGYSYIIRILNVATGKFIKTIGKYSDSVNSLAVLSDKHIISSSNYMGRKNNIFRMWDTKTLKCIKTFEEHSGPVRCLELLHDGHIVSACSDNTIRIWDPNTGECIKTFEKHSSLINCLAVLPDGHIVSGSDDDGIIRIWNKKTGKYIKTFEAHCGIICLATISNNRIISGLLNNTIKIWDLNTGKCIKTLEGHSDFIRCLAVLPDERIVSTSFDQTIRIWNIATGKCKTIGKHSYYAKSLAVFPDGRIVTACSDNTIRIWDSNTGECLRTIEWLSGFIKCLTLFHDRFIIGGSTEDNTIQIWDSNTGKRLDILEPTEVNVSEMNFSEAFMTEDTAKLLSQNGAIVPTSFIKEE